MSTQNASLVPLMVGVAAFLVVVAFVIAEAIHPFVMPALYGTLGNLVAPLGWQGFFEQLLLFRFTL